MVSQVSLLAETFSADLADARLESGVHPFVPMNGEHSIERFITVSTLELAGRRLLDLAELRGDVLLHHGNVLAQLVELFAS